MNWNAGQVENPAKNQNKFSGMVRVLPNFPPPLPTLPLQPHGATSAFTSTGSEKYAFILSGEHNQCQMPKNAVPRLPPPPKSPKSHKNKTVGSGKLENQHRNSFTTSFQDLTHIEKGLTQEWNNPTRMSSDSFYDRRKLHSSAHDLRETENIHVKPHQSFKSPVDSETQGKGNNSHDATHDKCEPPKFTTPKPTISSHKSVIETNQEFSTATKTSAIKHSKDSDMSSLHDEMAQLKLELAAMRDPMKEHEEWLMSQSVQVKELEELQRKLQLSMTTVNNNNPQYKTKTSSNMTNAVLKVPPPVHTTPINTPPPPTSPKPTFMKPMKDMRPQITSPKPTQQKLNSFKFSKSDYPEVSPSKPEITKDTTLNDTYNSGDGKTKFVKDFLNEQGVKSTKSSSTPSDVQVKRISQLFEANANTNARTIIQNKINPITDIKKGTVKKLSPALLQSLQSLQENQSFVKPLTSRDNDFQSTSRSTVKSPSLPTNQTPKSPKPLKSTPFAVSKNSAISLQPSIHPTESSSKRLTPSNVHPSFKSATLPNEPSISRVSSSDSDSSLLLNRPSSSPKPSDLPNVTPSSPKPTMTKLSNASYSPSSKPTELPNVLSPDSISLEQSSVPPPPPLFKPTILPNILLSKLPVNDQATQDVKPFLSPTGSKSLEQSQEQYFPIIQSKQHNESITDELVTKLSSKIAEAEHLSPSLSKSSTLNHRYCNVPDELEFQTISDEMPDKLPVLPPKDFLLGETKLMPKISDHDRPQSLPEQKSTTFSLHSSGSIARPTAPPPPPPTNPIQNVPTPPPLPTFIHPSYEDNSNELAPERASQIQPPPQFSALSQPKTSHSDSPQTVSNYSSEKSSFSSLSESPMSTLEPASKADLLEQIRQFKQSGKVLKRSTSEMGQLNNGTYTRVRKNSMQDALQTRFHAFCGNQSEPSDSEDDGNQGEDDWDD